MEQRPLEYTVKIYCEGFTEWYYFEWLRTNNRFKFSMEPDIPKNSLFRESILKSQTNREKAIDFSIKACKYEPIENEIANYTEVFKAIHFFRLLQKFAEIRLLLAEKLRANVAIQPNVASHKSLAIMHNENMICTLKYMGTILKCIFVDGQTFDVDDTKPLDIADSIIGYIAGIIK